MTNISILIADAQCLTRKGLRYLLNHHPGYRIAGEAENEEALVKLLKNNPPQVVILDYDQPGHFDRSTIRKIRKVSPQTRTLVISDDADKNSIFRVLETGINSFLTKSCGETEILDAVKATAKGEKFFCTKVLDCLLEKTFSKKDNDCAPTPLTPREIEIVRLVAQGLIAKEIAERLNLSTHTVYTHRKNIMKKLQLNTSSELVLYAVNQGLVSQTGNRS